jgi:glutaredoxin
MQDKIVVYGADWCEDTQRTRHQLESLGVPYSYVDVDDDRDASEQVKEWNGGRRVTPTLLLPEGNVVAGNNRLAAPSNEELERSLRDHGIR